MSDPSRLALLESIQAAIRGITVQAGYHYSVAWDAVLLEPVDLLNQPISKLPLVIVAPDERSDTRRFFDGQVQATWQGLITAAVAADSVDVPNGKIRAAERFLADLEVALRADLTRGGVCYMTRVLEPTIALGMGSDLRALVTQPIECPLVRRYGSP